MKALIVGGGGFLGSHLANHLHELGHKVTLFDMAFPLTSSSSSTPKKKASKDNFTRIQGHLEDIDLLTSAMKGIDIVYHVASPPYHLNNRALFYRVNVDGTAGLIKACRRAGVRRLVLTSSCSVIFNGTDIRNATEDTPFPSHYIDYYTETKMLQERLVLNANSEELWTVAIRPHGIFGPRDHTISELAKKAKDGSLRRILGDGKNIVDFTHVRNVTLAHILAGDKLSPGSRVNGQVYHITNLQPVHFWVFTSDVVRKLGYAVPSGHVPYWLVYALAMVLHWVSVLLRVLVGVEWVAFLTPFKVALAGRDHWYCCDKAVKELGYAPEVSLEDGIEDAVGDYKRRNLVKKE